MVAFMSRPAATPGCPGGEQLARVMRERALTQVGVAAMTGATQITVGNWIRGRRAPGAFSAELLDLMLGIPRRVWFTRDQRRMIELAERSSQNGRRDGQTTQSTE